MPTAKRRAGWRKSTYSDQGNGCVDVDFTSDGVEIRHSQIPNSIVITFTITQWSRWICEVITGEPTNANGAVDVSVAPNAWTVRERTTGHTLIFTDAEWRAFQLGAADGQFDPTHPSITEALAEAS
ncbi:hypothetical protein GCM10011609_85870 [Lentzea pudingi]|uniref:DUF397 domain-containing protein n=1 Tax=Lentzea pudingi TaxID=1789439 RepID=A0ABQ2ITI0_9PSEU|nr:DUF397 domain-containing protein [Lentzea pudingi]GGN29079.1 hypothetical protein GCM10011609_85870 [Lentzea pudingi]